MVNTQTNTGVIWAQSASTDSLLPQITVAAGDINTGFLFLAVKIHPQHTTTAGMVSPKLIKATVVFCGRLAAQEVVVQVFLPLPGHANGRLCQCTGGVLHF